ncbi:(4Fe-4S)-binding protein [Tamlana sp. 2_MG-2023]|uniref:(4Fe-4S)-binding protein n=1 Tax=unclassified Tamlana TaxID=2614803 RepID=UPI0026E28059|nr:MULTISPECIES: (4Fe-4S)-binding protein [unclassified Tamlana]MDO6760159.1 (4Fe-4S)-binding protein [Tamlana sp. 2_MG-2023]MDO6790143.1 (4Fe-4S)-binding protein [Tamlana sp. 1_MG-2023]
MKTTEYRNNEITISYCPFKCKQSNVCTKELSDVFQNSVIPWIDPNGSPTESIIKQIKKCPSGALKFKRHNKEMAY